MLASQTPAELDLHCFPKQDASVIGMVRVKQAVNTNI